MKNEKLDLMLNKVVEYDNPKADHFKAFLYKNKNGDYYFKIIEILRGDMSFNDIITLKNGDVKFLIIAAKPKLMVITKNSWHYKLMKYVLRSNAPTPKDMQNGCPYFWLVMFSMIALPFLLIFKAMKWTVLLIPKLIFGVLKQLVVSWFAGIDDEVIYDLKNGGNYTKTKIPKTAKIFFKNSDNNIFTMFLSEKYGVNGIQDPMFKEKQKEIKLKWEVWRKEVQKSRDENYIKKTKSEQLAFEKKTIRDKKREINIERWETKMQPIYDALDSMGQWFTKTFTVERGRRNMIIKRTKQVVGALVTILVLIGTFFAINYIALGLMVAADFCIEYWVWFVYLGLAAVTCGIIYGFYVLVTSVGQSIVNKYNQGKRVWYIEPFIYLLWYPIKYIVLSFVYILTYILWIPVRFIFYTCIWKLLSWVGIKIGKGFYNLGKFIIGSTGIFGEYFGASYSDYCPGLEWVGFEEEEEN